MQVKKEEMRTKIMEAAADEFLKRGYEDSSMRVIANKSHTTLGNIYHYFPNKESLLEAILMPTIENLEAMLIEHIKMESIHITLEEAKEYLSDTNKMFDNNKLNYLLDKRIVILAKLKSTHLLERKEAIICQLKEHLKWHFNMTEDNIDFIDIILNMVIECVKHVLIEYDNTEQMKTVFMKFFNLICTGIIGQIK